MSNQTTTDNMSGRPSWVLPGAMGLAATGVLLAKRRRDKAQAKSAKGLARKVKSRIGR